MIDVFNTEFETFLRVLLILNSSGKRKLTGDRITSIDFLTLYGKDFGVSDENLHGNNEFRFSEYSCKRELIFKAIKSLVIEGYIDAYCQKRGFYYGINDRGRDFCARFNNVYASMYNDLVNKASLYGDTLSDRVLADRINNYSIIALTKKENK